MVGKTIESFSEPLFKTLIGNPIEVTRGLSRTYRWLKKTKNIIFILGFSKIKRSKFRY